MRDSEAESIRLRCSACGKEIETETHWETSGCCHAETEVVEDGE